MGWLFLEQDFGLQILFKIMADRATCIVYVQQWQTKQADREIE